MIMSKYNQAIIYAIKRGYKVRKDGTVRGIRTDNIKLSINTSGYYYFCVHPIINNKRVKSTLLVHRLQAYQKYGDKLFKNDIQVRHLNNNKLDNSWDNIAIGTAKENMADSPYIGERIKKYSLQAGLSNSSLVKKDVLEIRQRVKEGNYSTYQKLAEEYDLKSKGTISDIVNRKTWKHI